MRMRLGIVGEIVMLCSCREIRDQTNIYCSKIFTKTIQFEISRPDASSTLIERMKQECVTYETHLRSRIQKSLMPHYCTVNHPSLLLQYSSFLPPIPYLVPICSFLFNHEQLTSHRILLDTLNHLQIIITIINIGLGMAEPAVPRKMPNKYCFIKRRGKYISLIDATHSSSKLRDAVMRLVRNFHFH